ncbi:MAG: DUF262 domain-containing protein, partial [Myxococcota bacterium]|nr:DUF262 domain-containing protein [Myxococcota bacterium]
ALTDKRFSELPRTMQRRIEETQVTVHLIQPGTPPDVKFNIFKRINTGGLPLSLQEIRHALYQGPGADLLQQLAALPEFVGVKGGSFRNERMADRECVLRFLSFVLSPYAGYEAHSLDRFLSQQMQRLNRMSEIEQAELSARFKRAMTAAYELFGNDAFRKRYNPADRRKPINKALFESWSIGLDALSDEELKTLVERRENLAQAFITLMNDPEFDSAISQGTGDPRKVERRFSELARIIRETLT